MHRNPFAPPYLWKKSENEVINRNWGNRVCNREFLFLEASAWPKVSSSPTTPTTRVSASGSSLATGPTMDTRLPFVKGQNPFDVHVYFKSDAEAALAATLKTRLLARFAWLKAGRWNDSASLISPHPLPMFEVFGGEPKNVEKVNDVIEWLDANRGELSVLIHPNTTDGNVQDHCVHRVWLGEPVAIRVWPFHAFKWVKVGLVLAGAAVIVRALDRCR